MRESAVTIRLTEQERSQLETEAEQDGRTLSDWIRRKLGLTVKKDAGKVDRRRRTA